MRFMPFSCARISHEGEHLVAPLGSIAVWRLVEGRAGSGS